MSNASQVRPTPLPATGYLRLPQIIGDKDADPPILGVFPLSKTQWYAGIREGRYPKPVKLGPRAVGWRVEEVRQLIESPAAAV